MDTETEGLITTEEVLYRVRKPMTLQTIRNWIRFKQFPKPRYIGARAYWAENDVEEWMRSQK